MCTLRYMLPSVCLRYIDSVTFSALYTTIPHNLIKEKLNDLVAWTFHREGSLYLVCNVRNAFLLPKSIDIIRNGHVRNV